jgi:2-phosphoglycerate kinase
MGLKKYIKKQLEPAIKADETIRLASERSGKLVSDILGSNSGYGSSIIQKEIASRMHKNLRRNLLRESLRKSNGKNRFLEPKVRILEKYLDYRNAKLNRK